MKKLLILLSIALLPFLSAAQDSLLITDGEQVFEQLDVFYPDSVKDKKEGKVMAYFTAYPAQAAIEKYMKNGKQNGIFKTFYPTGELMEFGVYGNGLRHGEWTHYNKAGDIVVKGKYKEGVRQGFWAYRGQKCYGRYKNGQKHGKWVCENNGEKVKTYYKNGEETGKSSFNLIEKVLY